MTDQELKNLVASLAIAQAKTDEQINKTTQEIYELKEQMKKTDEKIDRIAKMVGGISNNQGAVSEEFFFNSLKHKKSLAGIKYDYIDKNVTRAKGKLQDEFDILMINGKDIAIIETKYRANERDLEKLIHKKYNSFKELFPMYKDYNHHLALASFYIDDDLMEKALDEGVIVIQRKGDVIETFVRKNEI